MLRVICNNLGILDILFLIFAGILLLLPLWFWMYLFVALEHLKIGKKEFYIWIGMWIVATLPLVYEEFIFFGWLLEDIFFQLSYIWDDFLGLELFGKLLTFFMSIFLICILWSKFILWVNIQKYLYSSLWYSVFLLIWCITAYFAYHGFFSIGTGVTPVYSGSLVFSWLGAILWYYIVISLLEEWLKYFWNVWFLTSDSRNQSLPGIIAFAWVIALWFSFFENILYSYIHYKSSWTQWLLSLVFFRSLFTVSLHILCAMILATAFYLALVIGARHAKSYVLFFVFSWISIIAHALFDTSLSFWYTFVVFFYLFFLYLLVIYISDPGESQENN